MEAQNLRSAKGLLSLSIVFASPKCSHARTTSVLEALLGTAGILHGKITWIDVHRMRRLNTVYVKFCVYTGYVYIGETLTVVLVSINMNRLPMGATPLTMFIV